MSTGSSSAAPLNHEMDESRVEQIELLNGKEDSYGGVTVEVERHMDTDVFVPLLKASLSQWKLRGKKGIWIKLPIKHAHLVESVVKEGFRYHHAESDYLMLVHWISDDKDTIPANASHRIGIGAFVVNENKEVLVVQEISGRFKGTGVWKLPTGVVDEGEDICKAAIREVKEETGIETEFKEILAFRQSHKSFFNKSDLFFVCMLQPCSSHIEREITEIAEVKWMSIEEYASQPFVLKNEQFKYIAKICMAKLADDYTGFATFAAKTGSGKTTYIYRNAEKSLD